jgi:hypothetical protein
MTSLESNTNDMLNYDRNHGAMAQVVNCWPLTAEAQVRTQIGPSGICGGQSGTGTGFPINIIPPLLSILIYHMGINNRSLGGHSSETYSHAPVMNNSYDRNHNNKN